MVICVAGPIAAGKNFYCSQLQEQGYFCLDADAEIHKIIQEKQKEIFAQFEEAAARAGLCLRAVDGSLDRRALGRLLFRRPEFLERQERIVYPEFEARVQKLIDSENSRGLVINAALLYKTPKILRQCKKIIYVDAPLLVRVWRSRRRDKLSFLQILRRIKSQRGLYDQYKKFAADNGIEIVRVRNWGRGVCAPSSL